MHLTRPGGYAPCGSLSSEETPGKRAGDVRETVEIAAPRKNGGARRSRRPSSLSLLGASGLHHGRRLSAGRWFFQSARLTYGSAAERQGRTRYRWLWTATRKRVVNCVESCRPAEPLAS